MNIVARIAKAVRVVGWSDNLEAYNSADLWNEKYTTGYDLDIAFEASRYACVSAVAKHFAKEGPILDLGCGAGVLEKYIRALSDVRIVGVDYSKSAIDLAIERDIPHCDFVCSNIRTFWCAETFPLIVFNESLYYLEGAGDVLKRFVPLLQPNGLYLISMFRTPLSARVWDRVRECGGTLLHENTIEDGKSGHRWRIQVIRPNL